MENTAEAFQWSRERRVVGRNLLSRTRRPTRRRRRHTDTASSVGISACHCTLAYISLMGKSRVLQLRRSGGGGRGGGDGGGGRVEENCCNSSTRDLSLPPFLLFSPLLSSPLLCLPRTLFAAVVPLSILVVINTSAGSKRGGPPPPLPQPLLLIPLAGEVGDPALRFCEKESAIASVGKFEAAQCARPDDDDGDDDSDVERVADTPETRKLSTTRKLREMLMN